jgi:D-serine deaminase-like pyridoxal phosphate-dependent protein
MTKKALDSLFVHQAWDYSVISKALSKIELPALVIHLPAFQRNLQRIKDSLSLSRKTLRLATKSIRSEPLIQKILDLGGESFQGLMCFNVHEASFLSEKGFDDFLIAYPNLQDSCLKTIQHLLLQEKKITLMVDHEIHLQKIHEFWKKHPCQIKLPVCIDLDLSLRLPGAHLGVQRSSIRTLDDLERFIHLCKKNPYIQCEGMMGYEAQVAGVGEKSPFQSYMNPAKKLIKKQSVSKIIEKRKKAATLFEKHLGPLKFFNGGGTGSLDSSLQEDCLTEVTAGSGFLQSHLFDYYEGNQNEAAMAFALPITRLPEANSKGFIATCQSGGFIASGETGKDKSPVPFLPKSLEILPREGFGEVQTPIRIPSELGESWRKSFGYKRLSDALLGQPLFFRPSKAGEIAERFNEYLLFDGESIIESVKTYRGHGMNFF